VDGFVLGESVSSSEAAEEAAFAVMSPVIVEMSDEEFMAIVEGDPAADERLERLFKQPSPVGRHVELSE
jgi:hypothetical protein